MTAETTRLRLRVSPGAGRTALVGRHGDAWKVRVTEAPERGRANEAVLRLLAETLALPRTALTLVSGHGGREKIVELTGIGPALIERRLASAACDGPRQKGEAVTSIDTEQFRDALLEERKRVEHALATLRDEHPGSLDDEVEEVAGDERQPPRARPRPRRSAARSTTRSARTPSRCSPRSTPRSSASTTARTASASNCGKEIPVGRLEAHPWASLCIDCKRQSRGRMSEPAAAARGPRRLVRRTP